MTTQAEHDRLLEALRLLRELNCDHEWVEATPGGARRLVCTHCLREFQGDREAG